jgi:2',3'-cyclic-nucleotide 2'-phosphodiesterase (5'-nucleotidase family)
MFDRHTSGFIKIIALAALLALCFYGCGGSSGGSGSGDSGWKNQDKNFKLWVIHTSDAQGIVEPGVDNGEPVGGMAARMGFIKSARTAAEAEGANLLLLDAGDIMYSSEISRNSHGRSDIDMYDLMGYDAITIGNNDFRPDHMDEAEVRAAIAGAATPFLSANIYFDSDGSRMGKPYIIKEFPDGLRVAVIGVTTNMDTSLYWEDVTVTDPVAEAQAMVNYVRANENVDLVIVLSHNGSSPTDDAQRDIIGRNVTGVDLIIEGHTGAVLPQMKYVRGTPTVLVADGRYIGKGEFTVRNREFTSTAWQPIRLTLSDYPQDADMRDYLCALGSIDSCITYNDTGIDYWGTEDDLAILFTANIYGHLEPYNTRDGDIYKRGGTAARVSYIAAQKLMAQRQSADIVILDAGDSMYGDQNDPNFTDIINTESLSLEYGGRAEIDIMRTVGYDAALIGDRDFIHRSEYPIGGTTAYDPSTPPVVLDNKNISDIRSRLSYSAGLTWLSANLLDSGTSQPVAQSVKVIDKGNYKIGIFGITGANPWSGTTLESAATAAANAVTTLQGQSADFIIALIHTDVPTADAIANGVSGINVIINGGETANNRRTVNGIPVFSVADGRYVGRISFKHESGGFTLQEWRAQDTGKYTRHAATHSYILKIYDDFPVGYACEELQQSKGLVRRNETAIGDTVSDAFYYAIKHRLNEPDYDFAFTHGGNLYNRVPQGVIDRVTAKRIMRASNEAEHLVRVPSKSELLRLLTLSNVTLYNKGGFGIYSAALRFKMVTSRIGDTITGSFGDNVVGVDDITLNGATFDALPERAYYFNVNDYIVAGGDGYESFFTGATSPNVIKKLDFDSNEAVAEYLKVMYYRPGTTGVWDRYTTCSDGQRGITQDSAKDDRMCYVLHPDSTWPFPVNCSEILW